MINEITLRKLDNLGFGIDIDSLESYIIDYSNAVLVSDLSRYEYNYKEARKLLKELKPTSQALTLVPPQSLENDELDFFFTALGNERAPKVYGQNDAKKINRIKNQMYADEKDTFDLVAIAGCEGIDLSIVYDRGYLSGIYAISEVHKQFDYTEELFKHFAKADMLYIERFARYSIVELRAKATLLKDKKIKTNVICDTMHRLRTNIDVEDITLIYTDIFIKNDSKLQTYWNKLGYLTSLGFKTPERAMLRNIDREELNQAISTLANHMMNEKETDYIVDSTYIKKNSDVSTPDFIINYDINNIRSDAVFESRVRSITRDNLGQYINIVSIDCNKNLSIDKVYLDDVYKLESDHIVPNGKIKFRIVEGRAVLYNENDD